ncbi:MAG: hypothetical protein HC933_02560 [Pleurocapsa sp. SU_196_0]|nr:hypothetical protein [Pleurocapsa sp. SU_196_0]
MIARVYPAVMLSLLAVTAGLLAASMLMGFAIPRVVFAALIFAQGGLRLLAYSSQPERRRSGVVQFLISAVLAFLILTAT